MEINWTVLMYIVIGVFAMSGFFKGWWKEAILTVFLTVLVLLLQQPGVAELVIELLNTVIARIWELQPDFFSSIFENIFAVSTAGGPAQADASDPGTWLLILVLFIFVATLIGRFSLAGRSPTPAGSLLGGLIGVLNGFIAINLVREYLDGRSLPGATEPATEIALAGGSTVGVASSGVSVQATDLPSFTILDSIVPWIIIAIGVLIFLALINTKFSRDGLNVRPSKVPPFHK